MKKNDAEMRALSKTVLHWHGTSALQCDVEDESAVQLNGYIERMAVLYGWDKMGAGFPTSDFRAGFTDDLFPHSQPSQPERVQEFFGRQFTEFKYGLENPEHLKAILQCCKMPLTSRKLDANDICPIIDLCPYWKFNMDLSMAPEFKYLLQIRPNWKFPDECAMRIRHGSMVNRFLTAVYTGQSEQCKSYAVGH